MQPSVHPQRAPPASRDTHAKRPAIGRLGHIACFPFFVASVLIVGLNQAPFAATEWVIPTLVAALLLGAACLLGSLFQPGSSRRAGLVALSLLFLAVGWSFAGPQYSDWTPRARVTEGLSLASAGKFAIQAYYSAHGRFPNTNAEAGMAAPGEINGNHVESVTVSAGGTITVVFRGDTIAGQTIDIVPVVNNGQVIFDCRGGSVEARYRPSSCRAQ